jgi:hypothetical protein
MRTRFSAALQRELREGLREQRYAQVRPLTRLLPCMCYALVGCAVLLDADVSTG